MAKAHIVLVHGAYHQPLHWDPLVKVLQAAGHTTSTPKLPSVSLTPASGALAQDTAAIKQDIATAIDQGASSIVAVFHSYAGIPGFDALATLSPEQKAKVSRAVCVSAFVVPKGKHLVDGLGGSPKEYTKIEDGLVTVPEPIPVFYNDVNPTDAANAAAALLPSAAEAFLTPAEHEGWAEFPVTYVLCSKDEALPIELQQGYVEVSGSREDRKGAVDVVTLESSHSPMLSMPEELAKVLRKAAGEEV